MDLVDPPLHVQECVESSAVVDYKGNGAGSVVGFGEGAELLLASGVPDLDLDVESIDLKDPLPVLYADGEFHVGVEGVIDESVRERCFAHRSLPDRDEFNLVPLHWRQGVHNQY